MPIKGMMYQPIRLGVPRLSAVPVRSSLIAGAAGACACLVCVFIVACFLLLNVFVGEEPLSSSRICFPDFYRHTVLGLADVERQGLAEENTAARRG